MFLDGQSVIYEAPTKVGGAWGGGVGGIAHI